MLIRFFLIFNLNKMAKYNFFKVPLFILLSWSMGCSTDDSSENEIDENSADFHIARITEMDDSLNVLVDKAMNEPGFVVDKLVYKEAINRNLDFFKAFPSHEFAERALENACTQYLEIGLDELGVQWIDTLLTHFPNHPNKASYLEIQKLVYDNLHTYDPEKIKYYCEQMLAMGDELPEEKREAITFRLENIDKNFEELIILRAEQSALNEE